MYYKTLGQTGMKVSAVGMGVMRFPDEDIQANRLDKCAELVCYAYEKGINYFDTAPTYSEGKSEKILGLAWQELKRRGVKREDIHFTSKTGDPVFRFPITEADFFKRLEDTLKDLDTDYVDFYLLWGMLHEDHFQRRAHLIPWFEKAREQGLIRHFGASAHMEGERTGVLVEDGRLEGLQIGYNALNYRYRQEGLLQAYDKGMGVMIMNPLGGGTIPQNPKFFSYLTEGTNLTVAQAALRFVISHREVSVALNGFSNKEQVDDAVIAAENLVEYSAAELAARYAGKGESINDLCTGCKYCDHCPKGIPVHKYMDAYNEIILGGDPIFRMDQVHRVLATGARECVACGVCESKCTQHLPIIERLKEIGKLPLDSFSI